MGIQYFLCHMEIGKSFNKILKDKQCLGTSLIVLHIKGESVRNLLKLEIYFTEVERPSHKPPKEAGHPPGNVTCVSRAVVCY